MDIMYIVVFVIGFVLGMAAMLLYSTFAAGGLFEIEDDD